MKFAPLYVMKQLGTILWDLRVLNNYLQNKHSCQICVIILFLV